MKMKPDKPITDRKEDRLRRDRLVNGIVNTLISRSANGKRSTGLNVGLTGSWGSGKSSIINLVRNKLTSMSNVLVIDFNPWLFEDQPTLMASFFDEVRKQLGYSFSNDLRSVARKFARYQSMATHAVSPLSDAFSKLVEAVPGFQEPSLYRTKDELAKALKNLNSAFVVIVDELDRAEADDVRTIMRVVDALSSLPNVSFLLAYDRVRVTEALTKYATNGSFYLEKIVQFAIPLRPLVDDEVRSLIGDQLSDGGYDRQLGDAELFNALMGLALEIIQTPRDVLRPISMFLALEPLVSGEVNKVDVLGYCFLAAKFPELRDKLGEDLDRFVHDPRHRSGSFAAFLRQQEERKSGILPDVEEGSGRDLLEFLFPSIGDKTREDERFGRVQFRRNLMTLLYADDPPFLSNRKEVLRLYNEPDPNELEKIFHDGRMDDFLGILETIISEIPRSLDEKFWLSVSNFLRETDRQQKDRKTGIARDFNGILLRLSQREEVERSRTILNTLEAQNDLELLPDTCRYHMFRFGLVKSHPRRDGPEILEENVFKTFLTQELDRYYSFILSGAWVDQPCDVDIFYAVEQGGRWDSELREAVGKELRTHEGVIAFASTMFPPRTSMDSGVIGDFIDLDESIFRSVDATSLDDWTKTAVDAFKDRVISDLNRTPRASDDG